MWRYPPLFVRLGIRLWLLVALGALLALSLVPLFVAVANLPRAPATSVGGPSSRASATGEPGPGSGDSAGVPPATLVRLVALYMGTVALALLVFAYFSMTRLIVQPVSELSRAASRVAEGARQLDVPSGGPRELAELGASLARMTERLRADEEALRHKIAEVERHAAELLGTQRRLVRSERLASVGRLAAGLAHEIGNPIAAILGFQELLLEGGLDEKEQRDFIERMKRETERINRVVRDLLDFARPSMRELELGKSTPASALPGWVEGAARDAMALVAPQKLSRGVELTLDVEPDLPAVTLSHEAMVQVLLNLLLNAAFEVPKPGGRVVLRARRLPVNERGGAVGLAVRVEVEDNGRGIAPAVRDTLFEPFVTTKEVGEGTGLGLSVCRGLIEAAGGTITAEDAALGGVRFVLDLPAARLD